MTHDLAAGRSEPYTRRTPLEHLDAEDGLDLLDSFRQGGLSKGESLRSATEMQFLCKDRKAREISNIEHLAPFADDVFSSSV